MVEFENAHVWHLSVLFLSSCDVYNRVFHPLPISPLPAIPRAVAEIRAVVATIYTRFSTIVVDGDDVASEQQVSFLTLSRLGELLVDFVQL